jgi:hypothetical protein
VNHKRFFAGDEAGGIRNFLVNTGKINDEYVNQGGGVEMIRTDYENNLLVSYSSN